MTEISRRVLLAGLALGPFAAGAETPIISPDGALSMRPLPRPLPSAASLVERAGLSGRVAYAVMDDEVIVDTALADLPVPPASTLKTVTALYALDRLGPQHRFRTRVLRAGDMLVLAGGGDPHLDTDRLAELAADLATKAKEPPARFAVWGGALPQADRIVAGQADHLAYNPAISGMILNFNRVHLAWRRGDGGYDMALEARAEQHSPRAYTVTARPSDQAALFGYSADESRENWRVARSAMGRAGSRWLPIRKPELYAGDVFQTLCRAEGLVLPAPEVIDDLPPGDEVAGLDSLPLSDILKSMLLYSTNLTAEVVGLHASGAPDLAASGRAMTDWLRQQDIQGDFSFADHSGLSAASRITANAMVQMLAGPARATGLFDLLKADPLTEDLGRDTSARAAIRAKTGTLNFVSNLAGYATGANGRDVVFAIFCADVERRQASEGQELPAGVSTWTLRAKGLQRALIETWTASG